MRNAELNSKESKEMRKERIDRGIKVRSSDVFALSSWREMLYLAAPRLIPIAGCMMLPLILSIYWQKVLLSVAVFALLAISWDILEQSGMISLGQALFFGMGAYAAGIFNHYFGWSPFLTIPFASILGGLICTVILLPVLRLRGIYFSMVTLIIPLMLVRIVEATKIFGGRMIVDELEEAERKRTEMFYKKRGVKFEDKDIMSDEEVDEFVKDITSALNR